MSELFNSRQRKPKEPKRLEGLGSKAAHLARHIADAQPIKKRQQEAIENGKDTRCYALAHLAGILLQGAIAPAMEPIFNSLIANDKS